MKKDDINNSNSNNIPKEMWNRVDSSKKVGDVISRPSLTYWQDAWRRLKQNKLSMIGLVVIIILFLTAIFGPTFSKYSYSDQDLSLASLPPRLELTKISEGNYLHLANGLRVYNVTDQGAVVEKLKPIENNVMKKYQKYEFAGQNITLDYSSKPFKFVNDDGTQYEYYKKVFNKEYKFGTDDLGRDLLIRVIYGARISLTIAVVSVILNFFIGVLYGGISGYAGGRIDNIMMRIVDILYTVPVMLYVILLMVVMGAGLKTIILALGISYWVGMARIVRGQVLSLKEQEFVLAAKTLGASTWRILLRHLIPNAMGPIIVSATMMIPTAIFMEAFLSFIGLGISAPMSSWGTLCNDALSGLRSYPYQLFFPAGAITFTMLAFNFLGDGLRDALDPRLRK